jgi:hypothetical protein
MSPLALPGNTLNNHLLRGGEGARVMVVVMITVY